MATDKIKVAVRVRPFNRRGTHVLPFESSDDAAGYVIHTQSYNAPRFISRHLTSYTSPHLIVYLISLLFILPYLPHTSPHLISPQPRLTSFSRLTSYLFASDSPHFASLYLLAPRVASRELKRPRSAPRENIGLTIDCSCIANTVLSYDSDAIFFYWSIDAALPYLSSFAKQS